MIKFTVKCLFLAAVFLFGVLFGIQEANEGIEEVKGIDHLQQADQAVQAEPASATISEKRETLEDIRTFNVFSAVGDAVSRGITRLFRTGVGAVSSVIENLLS